MTRIVLAVPFAFMAADVLPGTEGPSGIVLQWGAFSVVCWLVWYLVTKRMPDQAKEHQEERQAAEARREARDSKAAEERERERTAFQETLQKVMEDSRENRDAFLAAQCKYRDKP